MYSRGGRGEAIKVGSDSQVDLLKRKAHFGQRFTQECDFGEWINPKWTAEAAWSVPQRARLSGGRGTSDEVLGAPDVTISVAPCGWLIPSASVSDTCKPSLWVPGLPPHPPPRR